MKVLLDHCVPLRFARVLPGHDVKTAASQGWAGLRNGELLRAAAESFDVFVSTDKGLQSQQNPGKLPLPVILLIAVNNRFETLAPLGSQVLRLLDSRLDNRFYVVEQTRPRRGPVG